MIGLLIFEVDFPTIHWKRSFITTLLDKKKKKKLINKLYNNINLNNKDDTIVISKSFLMFKLFKIINKLI